MTSITVIASTPEVLKSTAESFSVTVYDAGAAASVSLVSYTLYDSGGNEKASGSVTPVANVLTISILATHFTTVEKNCRVKWTFTVDSVIYHPHSLFDVVGTKIFNVVVDADLKKFYPNLNDDLWSGQSNYDTQIKLASEEVKGDLKNKGLEPSGIVDGAQIKRLVTAKAFEIIFNDFSKEVGDIWERRSLQHRDNYERLLTNTPIKYDVGQDEKVDSTRNQWGVPLLR